MILQIINFFYNLEIYEIRQYIRKKTYVKFIKRASNISHRDLVGSVLAY